jgi:hypothetical protein
MIRRHLGVSVVTLLIVAGSAGWALAQALAVTPVDPPIVLSGSDIGFRVEARDGQALYGKLVVRIDGEWVEAKAAGGAVRLETN